MEQEEKSVKKFSIIDNAVVYLIVTMFLIIVGQIVGTLVVEGPLLIWANAKSAATGLATNEILGNLSPALYTGIMYLETIGTWIVGLLYFLIVKKNRPLFKAISTKVKGNNLKNLLLGIVIGFVMNGICVLGAFLHKDIVLYFDSFDAVPFILVFLCVFVQSSSEELLCRGFLMQRMLRKYKNPWIAIIGNSVLFGAAHLLNEGITVLALVNIILVGIFFSLITYYLDSIWCAFAIHTAWNFTQNCIFGLPNSGIVMPFSVFKLDASNALNSFAYNVAFGVEATVLAMVVILVACVLVYLYGRAKNTTITNIWE